MVAIAWAGKVGLGPGVGLGIGDGCPVTGPLGAAGVGFQVAPGVAPGLGVKVADGASVIDGRLAI